MMNKYRKYDKILFYLKNINQNTNLYKKLLKRKKKNSDFFIQMMFISKLAITHLI